MKEMRSESAGKEAMWWGLRVQTRASRDPDKERGHQRISTGHCTKERKLLPRNLLWLLDFFFF